MAIKHFIIDTCAIIDNPDAIKILINGEDGKDKNKVYLSSVVIEELDHLKTDNRLGPQVREIIRYIWENKDSVEIIGKVDTSYKNDNQLIKIVDDKSDLKPILVTNDLLMRFKAEKFFDIETQELQASNPFKTESEKFTGFIEVDAEGKVDDEVNNCFYMYEGRLYFKKKHQEGVLVPDRDVWKITPKTIYQKAFVNLVMNDDIDVVSVQSSAGLGKSLLSLSCALQLMLQDKKYKKIYVFKSTEEIGKEIGFLPGSVDDKLSPYFKNVKDLIVELHELRPANKLFEDDSDNLNSRYIEFMPINFIRGLNLSQCVVIIEEGQNYSNYFMKTILSRMGQNVKCIINGDIGQVDTKGLNRDNNGLNWCLTNFNGLNNYGHITLQGSKSRGPICDMVSKYWK